MFVINGSDYTLVVFGTIGAVLFFVIQLVLCYKVKRTPVKFIPCYILLFFALLAAADLFGAFPSSGVISLQGIFALAIAMLFAPAAVGVIAAWVIYGIRKRKTR